MIAKAWNIVFVCIAALHSTNAQGGITEWEVPAISGATGTGADAIEIAEDLAVGATGTTFKAIPTGTDTIASYTLLTTGTPFSVVSGVLTLDSALDFETTASYTIEVRAVDSASNSGVATVTITVTDVNEAPTFASSTLTACVADGSTADQSVTTFTATDPDAGDSVTYTINSGDTNDHFKISGAELQVNTDVTLDQATASSYTLVIRATDDDDTPLFGDATLTVTVGTCNSATAFGISIMMTLMALVVSLY